MFWRRNGRVIDSRRPHRGTGGHKCQRWVYICSLNQRPSQGWMAADSDNGDWRGSCPPGLYESRVSQDNFIVLEKNAANAGRCPT